ncbi:MAG: hypothetical protein HQK58_12335 [Deltaproteobacteria bacterium]|nr:hypothetical protein [Deltaproteobacteria bacterium]
MGSSGVRVKIESPNYADDASGGDITLARSGRRQMISSFIRQAMKESAGQKPFTCGNPRVAKTVNHPNTACHPLVAISISRKIDRRFDECAHTVTHGRVFLLGTFSNTR